MFIQQPYDSKTFNSLNRTELTFLVNRYAIQDFSYIARNEKLQRGGFHFKPDFPIKAITLYGLSESEKEIMELDFPFYNPENKTIVFDMRKHYSIDKKSNEIMSVKRTTGVDFAIVMNALTGIWCAGDRSEMSHIMFGETIFGKWIAQSLSRSFGLTESEEPYIEILARIYYYRLFNRPEDRGDEFASIMQRAADTYYTEAMYRDVYDLSLKMETFEDFCDALFPITENVRLENVKPSVVFRAVQSNWTGTTGPTYTDMALEYPPVWLAMIYIGLKDNHYKRTTIGTIAQNSAKRGAGQAFLDSIDHLISIYAAKND